MTRSRLLALCAATAFTLLLGRITDRTTGQPLAGVQVSLHSGHATLRATTDRHGRFRMLDAPAGTRTLRYASDDVPPQSLTLTVHGKKQSVSITACSTTLDYSCANVEGGGGGG